MKIFLIMLSFTLGTCLCPGTAALDDFVTQVLEPTGGNIVRPKDWFFAENHRPHTYMWTVSREDTSGGKTPYTTGVRIQVFVGVKQVTGKSAEEFVREIVAAKKKQSKVIKECKAEEQDLFMRMCLEVEDGPHHILYSCFWGRDGLDIASITIAGTTKELWDTYAATFDRMRHFELIDMKRFEKETH